MSLCIWSSVLRDGKASGLNLLCGLIEHFTLHGVDVIAATLICLLKLARERRGRLLGKTYDLVSAYKQFPVHEEDRNVLRTGVMNTDTGDVAVFGSNVLSFGATGSVAGFLRISAALWHAGVQGLAIPWLAYYDAVAMKTLSRRAQGREGSNFVNDELRGFLTMLRTRHLSASTWPREGLSSSSRTDLMNHRGRWWQASVGFSMTMQACLYLSSVDQCTRLIWKLCLKRRHIPFMRLSSMRYWRLSDAGDPCSRTPSLWPTSTIRPPRPPWSQARQAPTSVRGLSS